MAKILVLNGPNLNMLGNREPEQYGKTTLVDIHDMMIAKAQYLGHSLEFKQSNREYELVEWIQQSKSNEFDFIIINPAGLTHTSVILRDSLLAVAIPFIEVHISNIFKRESFRHHSYLSDIAIGVISGLGAKGYELALLAAHEQLAKDTTSEK